MFAGLSAFPISPMDGQGRVDLDALSRIIEGLITAEVQSIGLLGSTGTYMFLSAEERSRCISAAVETTDNRLPVIVGVGAMRTDGAMALARDAEKLGADALLLAPVSYTPLTDAEVFDHFWAVADATGLPLCIYNNPGTTNFTFSHDLVVRLSEHPRIKAVKMPPSGDFEAEIAALRPRLPDGFALGYSADWILSDAMRAGADSFFTAVGGIIPLEVNALFQEARARSGNDVKVRFEPMWDLCRAHGSLRVIYAIAGLKGITDLPPPLPLQSLSKDDVRKVEAALDFLRI